MQAMVRSMLISGVAAAALVAGVSEVRAAEPDAAREARDINQIQGVMWHYVRALDTLDADAYAANFTPDGQFGTGERAEKGREQLKKMVVGLKKARDEREAKGEPRTPPMHHIITNSYVEFVDKDHARYHSYWLTVFGDTEKESPPRIAAAGRGIDELVRLNGQWLIKTRDVAPKD